MKKIGYAVCKMWTKIDCSSGFSVDLKSKELGLVGMLPVYGVEQEALKQAGHTAEVIRLDWDYEQEDE